MMDPDISAEKIRKLIRTRALRTGNAPVRGQYPGRTHALAPQHSPHRSLLRDQPILHQSCWLSTARSAAHPVQQGNEAASFRPRQFAEFVRPQQMARPAFLGRLQTWPAAAEPADKDFRSGLTSLCRIWALRSH